MPSLLRRLACVLLLAACSVTDAAELAVLRPLTEPAVRARPDGKGAAPVLEQLRDGKLYAALQREAGQGATAEMLKLDQLAMRIAGIQGAHTWLMLSREEGGFARRGFWLKTGAAMNWVDEPLVDLVVDEASVADGSFEEIFAHELGHVILRRLVPNLPAGYSRTPHHSFSITDQPTAFNEGWATHFQGIARRLTVNPRLAAQDLGLETKPFLALWQSNLDRETRIAGMRYNWFVHAQVTPPGAGDAIERRESSTLFDRARLKSTAQMLANEGAVATFFYRQLAPPPGAAGPSQRYEPMLRALHALGSRALTPDSALLPMLAVELARGNPDEGGRFIQTLVETSYGVLASPVMADLAEKAGTAGRGGDAEAFVPALKAARAALAAAVQAARRDPGKLAAQAGPAVWLLDNTRKIGGQPLVIDLNTAELEHLLALPGMDARRAQLALDNRRHDGNFRSLADFVQRAQLDAASTRRLEAMATALRQAGTFARE